MSNKLHNEVFSAIKVSPNIMVSLNRNADHSEPLHACILEDNLEQIWFFLSDDNRVASGGKTSAQYVNNDEKLYVSFSGQLSVENDEKTIKALYSPVVGAFFDNGILDESLRVMRLDIKSMEVWKQDLSVSTKMKMLAGIKVGRDELGDHTAIQLK